MIIIRSVTVIFSIGFVMFHLIGHHVHHGKSIRIRHIIYNAEAGGISSVSEDQFINLILVPLQYTAHINQKAVIVLSQMAHPAILRILPRCCKKFCLGQPWITHQQPGRCISG